MNMLATVSVAAAVPVPAGTTPIGTDPIFAAIDRHRRAYEEQEKAIKEFGVLEDKWFQERKAAAEKRMSARDAFARENPDLKFHSSREELLEQFIREEGKRRKPRGYRAADNRAKKLGDECCEAVRDLVDTRPQTDAGTRALLDYYSNGYLAEDLDVIYGIDDKKWNVTCRKMLTEILADLLRTKIAA